MFFLRGWPIHRILLAVALASLAPLVALEIANALRLAREDRRLADNLTHEAARALAANVDRLIDDSRYHVEHVAGRPSLAGKGRGPLEEVLQEAVQSDPRFAAAALVDTSGRILVAAVHSGPGPRNVKANADLAWVRELHKARSTIVSEPFVGAISGRWICLIAAPVPVRTGNPAQFVSASVDLEKVGQLLSTFETIPEATVIVVSPTGRVVARVPPKPSLIGQDLTGTPLGRLLTANTDGRGTAPGVDGTRGLYGFTRIPSAGWTLAVGIPEQTVLAAVRGRLFARLGILVLGVAAAILLAALASRAIARPIARLQMATDAVARGEPHVDVPIEGPREIRAMGQSFNRMVEARALNESAMVQLEDSLRRTERTSALGAVVAGVAHEIRGPLFGLKALVEILGQQAAGQTELERYLPSMRHAIERMSRVTNDLLDYGRNVRLQPESVPVLDLIEAAVEVERAEATARDIRIEVVAQPDSGKVRVDPRRGVDLLANLVDNAVRLSSGGGVVTIEARRTDEPGGPWMTIEVLDRGPGIAEADLARVFEPFFSRREGGTGIGLALVRRLVEEHGGRIVAANREGGGARFTVLLPEGEAA